MIHAFRLGDAVVVTDPQRPPLVEPFVGTVVYVNGDLLDVLHPLGGVECFPPEWCTHTEPSVMVDGSERSGLRGP